MDKKVPLAGKLSISEGVQQPSSVSDDAINRLRKARSIRAGTIDYFSGILSGNITALSQAITLTESSLSRHNKIAQQIIEKCLPYSGKSIRIGITGIPGVGKSSFIEAFGSYLISLGRKVAVLAIDPSSTRSGGSILGDKTRMGSLASKANAFIRPSPSGGSLGGVARKTRESVILCEAAGFDTIIIETIGVGQSETAVHSMVDFFLLLMLAGAGDELQGIKRGIMEMADLIAINKADGSNIENALRAKAQFQNALHLFSPYVPGWEPSVTICSAVSGAGIAEIWETMLSHQEKSMLNGQFNLKRNQQLKYWMYESVNDQLKRLFYEDPGLQKHKEALEKKVLAGKISSFIAAEKLVKLYLKKLKASFKADKSNS